MKSRKWIQEGMLTSVCALASMTLVGCAEEVADLLGANATKVEVTASVGAPQRSALTRGADGLDGSTGFSLIWSSSAPNNGSKVKVWADNGAGSFSDYSYKVTGAKALEAESSTPTFPAGVTSVSVYGWYPYTANNTFTIKSNQQSDADYCLSDLMLAQPASCTRVLSTGAVTPAALNFEHVMSKVKVVVSPVGDVTVTGVSLNGVLPSTAITYSGSASPKLSVGEASGSAGTVTLLSGGSVTSTSEAADRTFCGVFPAQSISGSFITISATSGGGSGTITYSFPSAKTFDQGTEYVANIEVNAASIGQTVSLGDWTGADGTVNITTGGGGSLALDDTSASLFYNGSNGTVNVTEGSVSGINASSADDAIATASATGSVVTIAPVAVGNTQVLVYGVKDGKMLSSVVNVTVGKGTPTVTAPAYVGSTLTYNSSAQTLITAGSSPEGTTMQYALGTSSAATGTWSTSLPTGIDAGTYYVWYKVEGGTNYNDVSATIISGGKAIGKATPTLTLSETSLTFTALESSKTFTITYDGDGALSASSSATGTATASLSSKTVTVTSKAYGSATITVSAAAGANYKAATNKTVSVEIASCTGTALASATVGMVICEHGKAHTATTGALSCGGTKVAVIGYRSGSNGYAVALVDAAQDTWNNITNSGANKSVDCTLADGKRGSVPAAPTGTTWKVLNKANYTAMWQAMGSADTYNATSNKLITDAGGTALSGGYWSSQENGNSGGWGFDSGGWNSSYVKGYSHFVRPVLAW